MQAVQFGEEDWTATIAWFKWAKIPRFCDYRPFDLDRSVLMSPRVAPPLAEYPINRNRPISLMKSTVGKSSCASIMIRWIGVHEVNACWFLCVDPTRLERPHHLPKVILSGTYSHTEEIQGKWRVYKVEAPYAFMSLDSAYYAPIL